MAVENVGSGIPDGLAVDRDGCVWIALFGAGEIRRFSPEGRLIAAVLLPALFPTSLCFGGGTLDCLFIATARRSDRDHTSAGKILTLDVGVGGRPTYKSNRRFGTSRAP